LAVVVVVFVVVVVAAAAAVVLARIRALRRGSGGGEGEVVAAGPAGDDSGRLRYTPKSVVWNSSEPTDGSELVREPKEGAADGTDGGGDAVGVVVVGGGGGEPGGVVGLGFGASAATIHGAMTQRWGAGGPLSAGRCGSSCVSGPGKGSRPTPLTAALRNIAVMRPREGMVLGCTPVYLEVEMCRKRRREG
jgi:hypothetical protein